MKKITLVKINIAIWSLVVLQYLSHALGLSSGYGEWSFLGQFGVIGFFLSLTLIPAAIIFGIWGIIAFLHGASSEVDISGFQNKSIKQKSLIYKTILYAFLIYLTTSIMVLILSFFRPITF